MTKSELRCGQVKFGEYVSGQQVVSCDDDLDDTVLHGILSHSTVTTVTMVTVTMVMIREVFTVSDSNYVHGCSPKLPMTLEPRSSESEST